MAYVQRTVRSSTGLPRVQDDPYRYSPPPTTLPVIDPVGKTTTVDRVEYINRPPPVGAAPAVGVPVSRKIVVEEVVEEEEESGWSTGAIIAAVIFFLNSSLLFPSLPPVEIGASSIAEPSNVIPTIPAL